MCTPRAGTWLNTFDEKIPSGLRPTFILTLIHVEQGDINPLATVDTPRLVIGEGHGLVKINA